MKHADFVHLHNHSDYSLLDGASPIAGMVARAAELKMPALALTDHGALFGAIEFYLEARKAGVKPIVGMEAYVSRTRRDDRSRPSAHHLVLLARDEAGFRNLMRLSSLAFLEGFYYKPRVDHEILARYADGLLALSACPQGEIATDLLEDRDEAAYATAMKYRELFGPEHFFLEVQNHGLEVEDKIRGKVRALSERTGIPIVATNDCHYLNPGDTDAQDILLCIQTGKTVSDAQRMRATANLHFRDPGEMVAAFGDFPDALRNTLAVAERCNLQLNFGKPLLPAFPLPEGERSAEDYLRKLAWAELGKRYPQVSEDVRRRFDYELDVICRMGFASYFLIVRDFIHFARGRGIGVGPGRGSVAGSLVAYALRITDIDPLRYGLIFERFLNPERVTMPDIDIDFDDLRRGEVIEYVKQKYGEHNVTQIITFGTMGAKGVVRDVGRALGMAFAEVDRLARLVPDGLGMTLERALELSPELKNIPQRGPEYERLLRTARTLEGLARHASTHAAGVLITPGPLLDYVPLYRQKDESVTTQWDMKAVEKAGLLKMDFLGLRTLSVLEEAVERIASRTGARLDLGNLPMDDGAAYRVFQEAETVAIFQFESTGMRDYLRRLRPTVFEDLIAMNALYRPGPMENIPTFIECKHGRQAVRYDHPELEPILKKTYGVFVYQEQVMEAAHKLAGFTLAQADELRRAMGKKLASEMEAKRKAFVEGCVKNRIPAAKAEKTFATMERFAAYAFNACVTGDTVLADARTGLRTTVERLFRERRPIEVHALDADWKLRPQEVVDVIANGRKPVFEVRTALGRRIVATANHPFRTLNGWANLEDLRAGDRIAAARRLPSEGRLRWPRHELVTLAGLLAEGNTCHPTSLYFYNNDPVLIRDFTDAVSCFPDTVARVHVRASGRMEVCANLSRSYRVSEGEEFWGGESIYGNLALVCDAPGRRSGAFRWAERLDLIGRKATEKQIPEAVFGLADEDLELFVGRLWSGDGFVANHRLKIPFYATSSPSMARQVQDLLSRLGMPSGLRSKWFRYRGGLRAGHSVHLVGDGTVETFVGRIGPHLLGREEARDLLERYLGETRRRATSADTIPAGVRAWVKAERNRRSLTFTELERAAGVSMKEFTGLGSRGKRGFRRSTIERLARFFDSPGLEALAHSDVYWDRIVAIEPRGEQDTYDLTVEHDHNFVANGLIVHNSHSAAYAMLAYQCAYLKAHHPAEFMAATLTSEMSDSARIVTLIEEARRLGLSILPPDVNRSAWKFTLEDGAIRFGLGAVRNVGQAVVESLVAARAPGGPFADLFDLACRLESRAMNRRVLESLVASGACDSLGADRATLFANAGRVLELAAALHRERASGQSSLFGGAGGAGVAVASPPLPGAPAWGSRERSAREKEVLGFYFSEHPLEHLGGALERVRTHAVAEALLQEDGTEVRLGGLLAEAKALTTRTGKRMAIVTLEDLSGRVECTVFPDTFDKVREALEPDHVVVISGRVEVREDRGVKILASEVRRFEEAQQAFRQTLHLEIPAEELSESWLREVDEILSSYPGESEVYLHIVRPDRSRLAMRSKRFRVVDDDGVILALRHRFPAVRARWGKAAV